MNSYKRLWEPHLGLEGSRSLSQLRSQSVCNIVAWSEKAQMSTMGGNSHFSISLFDKQICFMWCFSSWSICIEHGLGPLENATVKLIVDKHPQDITLTPLHSHSVYGECIISNIWYLLTKIDLIPDYKYF